MFSAAISLLEGYPLIDLVVPLNAIPMFVLSKILWLSLHIIKKDIRFYWRRDFKLKLSLDSNVRYVIFYVK
jgi:hypothetical protein